ncbi:probable GH family 25 lysozyme 3 [Montipora foliosa]|uniref:probable GH family 25 lysozyme 3 n=1 Tax=Montipora foliosa TaxID=591990 RepID=UPI0035F12E45
MNYPLLGSNYENGMHPNFGPTLGEPTVGYSDSWSFLTQSGTQEPVQSKVFQNSQTTSEDSNEEETFEENKQSIGPTLPQDGTHFKDGSVENAQDLSENINSTTQSPENQGQSSINKTKPDGEGQPGNVNQGNSGAGAIPSAGEVVASKNVAASSGSSGNLAGSPGNPTGSGPLVNNGKVSPGTGSTGTNGGSFQGGAANTVGGAASNSGQQALTGAWLVQIMLIIICVHMFCLPDYHN